MQSSTHAYDRATMSVANLITLARGALIAPVIVLFFSGQRTVRGDGCSSLSACATSSTASWRARGRSDAARGRCSTRSSTRRSMFLLLSSLMRRRRPLEPGRTLSSSLPQIGLGLGALVLHLRASSVQAARLLGKAASLVSFVRSPSCWSAGPAGRSSSTRPSRLTYARGSRLPVGRAISRQRRRGSRTGGYSAGGGASNVRGVAGSRVDARSASTRAAGARRRRAAVEGVSDDRMADVLEVNADLMCSACVRAHERRACAPSRCARTRNSVCGAATIGLDAMRRGHAGRARSARRSIPRSRR